MDWIGLFADLTAKIVFLLLLFYFIRWIYRKIKNRKDGQGGKKKK